MLLDTEPGSHTRMEDFCFGGPGGIGSTVSLDIYWEEMAVTLLAQLLFLLFLVISESELKSILSHFLLKIDEEKFEN